MGQDNQKIYRDVSFGMKNLFFQVKKTWAQLFLYPASRISEKGVDYDEYWKTKRKNGLGSISQWQKQRADLVVACLKDEDSATFLDVGCGDGSMLRYIQDQLGGSRAAGMDISLFALNKAKELGIETICADIRDVESIKKAQETDYIFLFEVLEHIQNSEEFLDAAMCKAKKGVFFSFPNSGFYVHRLRLLFGKFPMQWRVHPGEHVRFWTYADVLWWMKALGYDSYVITPYEGVPILNRIWPSLFAAGVFVQLKK